MQWAQESAMNTKACDLYTFQIPAPLKKQYQTAKKLPRAIHSQK